MQVFTPYPQPFACADCLDPRRLNKQIIECKQILAAIRGESQENWYYVDGKLLKYINGKIVNK